MSVPGWYPWVILVAVCVTAICAGIAATALRKIYELLWDRSFGGLPPD